MTVPAFGRGTDLDIFQTTRLWARDSISDRFTQFASQPWRSLGLPPMCNNAGPEPSAGFKTQIQARCAASRLTISAKVGHLQVNPDDRPTQRPGRSRNTIKGQKDKHEMVLENCSSRWDARWDPRDVLCSGKACTHTARIENRSQCHSEWLGASEG